MAKAKRNYSRFYAICKAKGIDLEQFKEDLITEFTHGRSSSLKDMTDSEYEDMCNCLQYDRKQGESSEEFKAKRRKARSMVLTRIQKLGVDTTDFSKVDEFCLNRRISGKPFAMLTIEELESLVPKLEAMLRKPKPQRESKTQTNPIYIYFRPSGLPN